MPHVPLILMRGGVVTGAQKPADQFWVNYSQRRKLQGEDHYIYMGVRIYIYMYAYVHT